ncbi:hypothetical protein VTI28DRAFT_7618 [Corynascus sepedonium]
MHGYPTDESPDIGSNGNYVKEKQEAAQRAIAPDYSICCIETTRAAPPTRYGRISEPEAELRGNRIGYAAEPERS